MLDKNNAIFESKLLAKIKDNKICPKPKWQFLLQDSVVWFMGVVALLIGAAAISVMIYLFKFNDWEIYDQTKKSFIEFFILTLPYFWFVFLSIFIFILYYNFKHTKKGYHYSALILIAASILLSIVLGVIFYVMGFGERLDNILGSRAPFYDQVINRHVDFWSHPEEGRLSGLVIDKSSNGEFILRDRENNEWLISSKNSEPYSNTVIIVNLPIRLLGKKTGDATFRADKILPINSGRDFFNRSNGPQH